MRALVQRATECAVSANGETRRSGRGLAVLVGVMQGDTEAQALRLAERLINLRCFDDAQGKMNLSVKDIAGGMLLVSQFTLCADTRKGNRPSFIRAAAPDIAQPLFDRLVEAVRVSGIPVVTGWFRTEMQVHIVNDGPVTFIIDAESDAACN